MVAMQSGVISDRSASGVCLRKRATAAATAAAAAAAGHRCLPALSLHAQQQYRAIRQVYAYEYEEEDKQALKACATVRRRGAPALAK